MDVNAVNVLDFQQVTLAVWRLITIENSSPTPLTGQLINFLDIKQTTNDDTRVHTASLPCVGGSSAPQHEQQHFF